MNSDTKGRMFGLLVLGVIVVTVCSGILSGISRSVQSERWPRVAGRIIGSEVDRDGSDVAPKYIPAVEFRYSVGDVTYTSHRIRFLMAPIYQREVATHIQNGYVQGREVSIAYNPESPAESVLEPGLPPGTAKQIFIAIFLLGITAYIFFEIHNPTRRILLRTFGEDDFDGQTVAVDEDPA